METVKERPAQVEVREPVKATRGRDLPRKLVTRKLLLEKRIWLGGRDSTPLTRREARCYAAEDLPTSRTRPQAECWLGGRDSNPDKRSQSPLSYR